MTTKPPTGIIVEAYGQGPLFWPNEKSGRMAEAVRRLFDSESELGDEDVELLKWYVGQWVEVMPHPPIGWRARIARCANKYDLSRLTRWLLENAIDPF